MAKKILLVLSILFFCVAVVGWILMIGKNISLNHSNQAYADLSTTVIAREAFWGAAQEQVKSTATAREQGQGTAQAELKITSDAQQALLSSANEALLTATLRAEGQATLVGSLRHTNSTQAAQIVDLDKISVCDSKPANIDYTSNSTVSASLKRWLEDQEGTIKTAEWEAIWNNSRASIHRLTGEYLWIYIVYFDQSEWNLKESVYDVRFHCFLDP